MKKIAVLAVLAASGAASAQTWDSGVGGVNFVILDVVSNQNFAFTPTVFGSSVTGFDIFMNPVHTWRGDLAIRLTAPGGGGTVNLYGHEDGSGDFISCFFADSGVPITTSGNLDSATSGVSYHPTAASLLSSLTANAGSWTLSVDDTAAGDVGTINRIRLTTAPAPASLALLGLGGLIAGRRRRA